jgi:hypothetical protein
MVGAENWNVDGGGENYQHQEERRKERKNDRIE